MSKSAKKNEKRREKKRLEAFSKGNSVLNEEDKLEQIPLKDPMTVLKEKLNEAKANGDHKLAAQLRQDIWVLQDVNSGHEPANHDAKSDVLQSLERLSVQQSKQQKEQPKEQSNSQTDSAFDKDIRKLKKKLDQIERLKQLRDSGEKLEASQIEKMDKEESIHKEIQDIEKMINDIKIKRKSFIYA